MEVLSPFSLRNADVEIVKRTVTEEHPSKHANPGRNNNNLLSFLGGKFTGKAEQITDEKSAIDLVNNPPENGEEDYIVIELVDETEHEKTDEILDSFVEIDLKSSKQLLVYLAKKRRFFVTCRTRAVSQAPLLKKHSTGRIVMFLQPFFRLTVSTTEFWYVKHGSSIYIRPARRNVRRRPIHYTEKVECDNAIRPQNTPRKKDMSGFQLIFSDEKSQQVSKLTLSGDFTKSHEERDCKLHDISYDIETSEEDNKPGSLRRSYSIEFLNEGEGKDSLTAENVAQKIEQGDVKEIYYDSTEDGSQFSRRSFDSAYGTPSLKRSFSIEFLKEADDEDKPFSAEMVHYKIDKGEGVLVYSDVEIKEEADSFQHMSENDKSSNLKRSYSIEFLDESQDNKSAFSFETISNKIEKGEGKLVYEDSQVNDDRELEARPLRKRKAKSEKLKTLGVQMDVDEDLVPLSRQPKAYSIEMLSEIENKLIPIISDTVQSEPIYNDDLEEEIVAEEVIADQSEMGLEFLEKEENFMENDLHSRIVDIDIEESDEHDLTVEKRSFSVEFLDEKRDLSLVFENNKTSTPTKKALNSPKKSPLQTVHVGLEFEKRNKSENDDDEIFGEDCDEYLVYEDNSVQREGRIGFNGSHRIPSFKLKTIVVDMDTHHKRKMPSLQHDLKYQLEFQTERERRISMMREARKARIPSSSSASLRTVSIETDQEEVIHDENELKPPELLKKKAYSVEYLNEIEGDRSVFYEEFVDDGELKWTMEC